MQSPDETTPALKRFESRPIYQGQLVLQYQRRPSMIYAHSQARDVQAHNELEEKAQNNLSTETVILNPNRESPIYAIVVEKSADSSDLLVIPRTAAAFERIPAFINQGFHSHMSMSISGRQFNRTPVDTLSWLEEKAQDGLCDALTPEHRCESAFSHTESLHDELKTRKRELATICNKLKKIGFVGGWSGIDDRIMDIAKAAMENKTTPTMLEGLDAKLSAKLEPLHHRPSARASSLVIGGTAEETY